jgi:hypothetical protein
MGADCSDRQTELVVAAVKPTGRIWAIPDGDSAGERFTHSVLFQLSKHRFVRRIELGADLQPTDLSSDELKTLFKL